MQPLHAAADWAGAVGLLLLVEREAENENSCADGHDFLECEVYSGGSPKEEALARLCVCLCECAHARV